MRKSLLALLTLVTASCATGYNPRYYFNDIQVVNLTGATIEDVKVRILETSKVITCEEVLANALCQDYLARRPYPQQGVELSWTHTDGVSKSDTFNPDVPVTLSPAFPLRIVVEIREDGTIKPFFEQETPFANAPDPIRQARS